jgi:hypothetical protein
VIWPIALGANQLDQFETKAEIGFDHECDTTPQDTVDPRGAGSISTAKIRARLAAIFGDDNADNLRPRCRTAGCGRTEPHHITIRTGRHVWLTPRRTCPMNLNVALLLLVLAGGIGGTAAILAALRRSADRARRAVFPVTG